MAARTWRWLGCRIAGLLTRPPAAYVESADPAGGDGTIMRPVWATRIQTATT